MPIVSWFTQWIPIISWWFTQRMPIVSWFTQCIPIVSWFTQRMPGLAPQWMIVKHLKLTKSNIGFSLFAYVLYATSIWKCNKPSPPRHVPHTHRHPLSLSKSKSAPALFCAPCKYSKGHTLTTAIHERRVQLNLFYEAIRPLLALFTTFSDRAFKLSPSVRPSVDLQASSFVRRCGRGHAHIRIQLGWPTYTLALHAAGET